MAYFLTLWASEQWARKDIRGSMVIRNRGNVDLELALNDEEETHIFLLKPDEREDFCCAHFDEIYFRRVGKGKKIRVDLSIDK